MQRIVTYDFNSKIQCALNIIPKGILDCLNFDWLIGVNPLFIGLHNYVDLIDGRSYKNTGHVCYVHNQILNKVNRKTTIVIPDPWGYWPIEHIVHEVGHVFHEYLNWVYDVIPVTEYAQVNNLEAFAEAFVTWLYPDYATMPLKTPSGIDNKTFALLESFTVPKL